MPNHQPILKGLLVHEHLLTRDFQGDQHFFRKDGSVAAYPTMPGSMSSPNAGNTVTQIVPHEDAPAFSDVATTATAAATSPLTTFSPTTPAPPMSLPQKKQTKEAERFEPTTDSLTTPHSKGSASEDDPVVSVSSSGRDFPSVATAASISSSMMDKGPVRKTALRNKTSPDHPLPKLIPSSQEEGPTIASPTVITTTTITTLQTSGRFSDFQR